MLSRQKQEEYKQHRLAQNYQAAKVQRISDQVYKIDDGTFTVIANINDAVDEAAISDRYMDIFDHYDFILGDWSFEQLRLKGFYDNDVKKVPHDKYISHLTDYLLEFCSFGCAYFVMRRERSEEEREIRNRQIHQTKPSRSSRSSANRQTANRNKPNHQPRSKPGSEQNEKMNKKAKTSPGSKPVNAAKKATQPAAKKTATSSSPPKNNKQFQIHDKKQRNNEIARQKQAYRSHTAVEKTIVTKNGANPKIKTLKQGE